MFIARDFARRFPCRRSRLIIAFQRSEISLLCPDRFQRSWSVSVPRYLATPNSVPVMQVCRTIVSVSSSSDRHIIRLTPVCRCQSPGNISDLPLPLYDRLTGRVIFHCRATTCLPDVVADAVQHNHHVHCHPLDRSILTPRILSTSQSQHSDPDRYYASIGSHTDGFPFESELANNRWCSPQASI